MFLLLVNFSRREYMYLNKTCEGNYIVSVLLETPKLYGWDIKKEVIETFISDYFQEDVREEFGLTIKVKSIHNTANNDVHDESKEIEEDHDFCFETKTGKEVLFKQLKLDWDVGLNLWDKRKNAVNFDNHS